MPHFYTCYIILQGYSESSSAWGIAVWKSNSKVIISLAPPSLHQCKFWVGKFGYKWPSLATLISWEKLGQVGNFRRLSKCPFDDVHGGRSLNLSDLSSPPALAPSSPHTRDAGIFWGTDNFSAARMYLVFPVRISRFPRGMIRNERDRLNKVKKV